MYEQLQRKEEQKTVQRPQIQRKPKPNRTGLPDNLKDGIERLSGYDMSDVKVHYNSAKPAQLNAHAYAQGNQIHLGSGQEKHLPHEAWHVVQQKQGRVRPTMQVGGQAVNDNVGLEKEADTMGGKAAQMKRDDNKNKTESNLLQSNQIRMNQVSQAKLIFPKIDEGVSLAEAGEIDSYVNLIRKSIPKSIFTTSDRTKLDELKEDEKKLEEEDPTNYIEITAMVIANYLEGRSFKKELMNQNGLAEKNLKAIFEADKGFELTKGEEKTFAEQHKISEEIAIELVRQARVMIFKYKSTQKLLEKQDEQSSKRELSGEQHERLSNNSESNEKGLFKETKARRTGTYIADLFHSARWDLDFSEMIINEPKKLNGVNLITGKKRDPLADGWYMYTLTADRKLRYFPTNNYEHEKKSGKTFAQYIAHTQLANGEPVFGAGTFKISGGQFVIIVNDSGHYRPPKETLQNVKFVLESIGYEIGKGVLTDQSDIEAFFDKNESSKSAASEEVKKILGAEKKRGEGLENMVRPEKPEEVKGLLSDAKKSTGKQSRIRTFFT